MINFFSRLVWSVTPKKIYGLIGAAGTGKSFRAYLIAEKYKIGYIIDDGLLIKGEQIIAGKSAKKENLRVTAVKRAIFHELKHAREVRKMLHKELYTSLLIIGTSQHMIDNIVTRLHLPKPMKIIKIEDVATEKEIRLAQKSRNKHGKHVMPIPLLEVKKKYPNIILHAIHFFVDEPKGFFFKRKKRRLVEKTIVRPKFGDTGNISISETALVQMVEHCIEEYSHFIKLLKVSVIEEEDSFFLKLDVSVNYKMNNMLSIRELQDVIKNRIHEFTKIDIEGVDINIVKVVRDKK